MPLHLLALGRRRKDTLVLAIKGGRESRRAMLNIILFNLIECDLLNLLIICVHINVYHFADIESN